MSAAPVLQIGNETAVTDGEVVHLMVRYLAGSCDGARVTDGVGFNKLHASFGRQIADLPFEAITPRQLWAARKMIETYKNTQLKNFWSVVPDIPEPPKAWSERREEEQYVEWRRRREPDYKPEAPHRTMGLRKIAGKSFVELRQNYNPKLIERIKALSNRKYDAASQSWLVPLQYDVLEELSGFVAEEGYELTTQLHDVVGQEIDRAAQSIAFSHAFDEAEAATIQIDLPDGLELYPFQKLGVRYIQHTGDVLVADQMGLGKTVQGLIGARELNGFPIVVICPASLKANWKREAEKWLPGRKVAVLDTKLIAPLRWTDGAPAFDVVILNYDILTKWQDYIIDLLANKPDGHGSVKYGTLIVDECHRVKNPDAQRTKRLQDIVESCPNINRIFMSGSPVVNRPMEFWTLIKLLGYAHDMGGYSSYKALYDNNYKPRLEDLNRKARSKFMLRRLKRDVLKELPDKKGVIVELPITNRPEYEEAERNIAKYFAESKVAKMRTDEIVLEASMAALEVGLVGDAAMEFIKEEVELATGMEYSRAFNIASRAEQLLRWEALKQLAVKGKMKAVQEWLDEFLESGEKIVVFATHTEVVETIARKYNAPYIHGSVNVKHRQALVDRFQEDPDCKMIVGNINAMGEGLTLTAASDVAFVEFGWNPKDQDQAEDRCHRIGQKDAVMVWNLCGEGTIDYEISALIEEKRQVTDAIQDGSGEAKQQEMMDALRDRLLRKRVEAL